MVLELDLFLVDVEQYVAAPPVVRVNLQPREPGLLGLLLAPDVVQLQHGVMHSHPRVLGRVLLMEYVDLMQHQLLVPFPLLVIGCTLLLLLLLGIRVLSIHAFNNNVVLQSAGTAR